MSKQHQELNSACKGCHNYKENGGNCPGAKPGDFYYPTDCSSWDNGTDPMEAEDEMLEEMCEEYERNWESQNDEWENDEY